MDCEGHARELVWPILVIVANSQSVGVSWIEIRSDVLFIRLDPVDKPIPDIRYVLLRKFKLEAQVDEFDEIAEVVIVAPFGETAIEHNGTSEQSPLRPGFSGKV